MFISEFDNIDQGSHAAPITGAQRQTARHGFLLLRAGPLDRRDFRVGHDPILRRKGPSYADGGPRLFGAACQCVAPAQTTRQRGDRIHRCLFWHFADVGAARIDARYSGYAGASREVAVVRLAFSSFSRANFRF